MSTNNELSMSKHIQIYIHSLDFAFSASNAPRVYVRVRIADRKDCPKTRLHLGHIQLASWQEALAPVAVKDTSEMSFELRDRFAWKCGSSQIAETKSYPLSKLLKMQVPETDITLPLCAKQGNQNASIVKIGTLRVAISVLSSLEAAKLSLDGAQNTVDIFTQKSKTLSAKHAARYKASYEALKPICGILDIVGTFIAFSPEPICSAVIGIICGAAKSVQEQIEQDADVLGLIKTIDHIYYMVAGTTQLHTGRREWVDAGLEDVLRELVTTLGDCTKFMLKLCTSSFLRRVSRTPEKTKELQKFQERLEKTLADLERALLLDMAVSAEEIPRGAEKIVVDFELSKLARVQMDTEGRPRCTDGKHATTLAAIKVWATSPLPDSKNICWLRGRSADAVVTTLFLDLLAASHLVGNFFFEKDNPKRDPALLIQTLASQLAFSHDADALKLAIAQGITANKNIANESLEEQFEQLLLRPFLDHGAKRPVVLLVDRPELYEPEHSAERDMAKRVLRILVEGSARFPPNVRLLIGTRRDEGYSEILKVCPRVVEFEMAEAEVVEPNSPPVIDWSKDW